MIKLLEKYTEKQNKKIDPRWEDLNKLKNFINKWLIQREKSQKLEEIKEELITKRVLKQLKFVKLLVKLIYITEHMNMKEKFTTREN